MCCLDKAAKIFCKNVTQVIKIILGNGDIKYIRCTYLI